MKKDEAERNIRRLCHTWRKEVRLEDAAPLDLHFSEFWNWMKDTHFQYTAFKAAAGPEYMAEIWFDQEFNLSWTR